MGDPFNSQPAAAKSAVASDGFIAVMGTGRRKAARRGKQMRESDLVKTNQAQKDCSHSKVLYVLNLARFNNDASAASTWGSFTLSIRVRATSITSHPVAKPG